MSERTKKTRALKAAPAAVQKGAAVRVGTDRSGGITAEVKIDPHNPIPLELENVFGFSPGGNKFIPFFSGADDCYGNNAFFINILRARQESNTQNSCIVAKTKYTIGDGVYIDSGEDEDGKDDPQWTSFYKRANVDGKNLNTVLKEIIDNFYTFGNVCIEIVKGEVAGKRFLFVYCKNTLDCRKSWPDENNTSNAVVISRWFRKPGVYNLTQRFNIRIPFYQSGPGNKNRYWLQDAMATPDPEKDGGALVGGQPSSGMKVFRTAIWIKDEYPGYDHYGLPSWLPSLIFGKLEFESAFFNLDNLNNNMNPGGVLTVSASMDDTEVDKMSRKVNKQYLGKGKRGRLLLVAAENGVEASKFTPFTVQKDGSYIDLVNISRDEIITANEWDGALIGKVEKGSMGKGGSYINELYQQKVKTVIKPVHRKIKDEFLVPLCEIADEWLGTNWSSYDLDIAISNLFDDTTEASTTVAGIESFMEIVKMVASGSWPLDAAIKFVADRFGVDEKTAKSYLGNIVVTPPVTTTKTENI
jgi:hypothetical protein